MFAPTSGVRSASTTQPEAAAAEYEIANKRIQGTKTVCYNLATLYLQSLTQPERAIALLEQFRTRFPRSGGDSSV